ncbi:MAG: NUDIX hydrolase [Acidimicrobiales bacterium]|nr:NUDIX hydrolase [Acidimicrobiales bacterium]
MTVHPKRAEVRAAGGIVVRADDPDARLLLVHRPDYDDWTFPKGKSDPGERWRETAIREVLEETGFACTVERKVGAVRYFDRRGRSKEVRYFLMVVDEGSFEPNDEVDGIQWCTVDEALMMLSYQRDRDLLVDRLARVQLH